jgi:NADH:ubiquinone oxidoreductase subunit 3 (subunit A)
MSLNLLTPPLAWIILLFAAYVLFQFAGTLAAKPGKEEKDKNRTYSCGEIEPPNRPFSGVGAEYESFFGAALFFTVTEVAVLLMITLPMNGRMPVLAYGLLAVILICSAGLLGEIRGARR